MPSSQVFTEFVTEHQAALRMYLRGSGLRADWVDDVAQECFLIAYKRFKDFDPQRASGATWLRGIAKHLLLNESRKQARRSRLVHNGVSALLMRQAVVEERSDAQLDAMRLCLSRLTDDQDELIRLYYAEDLSTQGIAAQLGVQGSRIRKRLSRLRMQLRDCVQQRLQDPRGVDG